MIHQTSALPTMKDAVAHVEAHSTDSTRQDIRKARVQRYYAWINARQSVKNVQADMARRRAEIMAKRAGI